MEKYQKTLLALIIVLLLFSIHLLLLIFSFVFAMHDDHVSGIMSLYVVYHIPMMILLGLFGVALGVLSYYGFTAQQKTVEKSIQGSQEVLMRFLDSGERIVVNYLVDHPEEITTQAHISRLEKMGKVRSHRTLQRLVEKEIILLVPYGKTKRITFHEDFKRLFNS